MKDDAQIKKSSTTTDLIYKLDSRGNFTYVNERTAHFFGLQPAAMHGRHFTEFVAETHREKTLEFYLQQLELRNHSSYYEFPVTINGSTYWLGQSVELITENGALREVLAVARDISSAKAAERKLTRSESRLQGLIESINAGILIEDENRRIVYVNQKFCEIFQIPVAPSQLEGADCSNSAEESKHLFADPEGFVNGVNEILRRKEEKLNEIFYFADGRVLERDYKPLFIEGEYAGHFWLYRDVTDRVYADLKIRESEERYRRIIENINLGLLEVDTEHHIQFANQAFCDVMGYEQEELLGQNARDLLVDPSADQQSLKRVDQENERRVSEKSSSAYELQLRHKDGSYKWFIISGTPIYGSKGEVTGSLGIHQDITQRKADELKRKELIAEIQRQNQVLLKNEESLRVALRDRKQAEQALRANEEKLNSILESAMDGVVNIDENGIVTFWNKMASQMFGFGKAEAMGKRLSELIIPEKHREAHETGMKHYLQTGEGPVLNSRIEITGVHKSGKVIPIELSIIPIQLAEGVTFSAFIRDITLYKQSKEEMEDALRQQQELNKMRSRFLSMTSHELRTPLTTLKSNVEIVKHRIGKAKNGEPLVLEKPVSRMESQLSRLNELMNSILLIGKANDGKIAFRPVSTDLVTYIRDIIEENFNPWQDGRSIDFKLDGPPRLVKIDSQLFQHILNNLIVNAFKFSTDRPAPQLKLIYTQDWAELQVRDFGIGIPLDEQDKIFSSFYRGENTRKIQGSGMGLAIVKQFLELHAGKINLTSTPGEGTTITLKIPAH